MHKSSIFTMITCLLRKLWIRCKIYYKKYILSNMKNVLSHIYYLMNKIFDLYSFGKIKMKKCIIFLVYYTIK